MKKALLLILAGLIAYAGIAYAEYYTRFIVYGQQSDGTTTVIKVGVDGTLQTS